MIKKYIYLNFLHTDTDENSLYITNLFPISTYKCVQKSTITIQ